MKNQFFEYSLATQRGILALLIILVLLLVWRLWPLQSAEPQIEYSFLTEQVDSQEIGQTRQNYQKTSSSVKIGWRLRVFDPNYAKAKELRAMGFSSQFISNWFKTKNTVGFVKSLRVFEELQLLDSNDFNRVSPYLDFSRYQKEKKDFNTVVNHAEPLILEINRADSTDFKQLKGIGNVLSKRIIKYRTKLGGFWSVQQLAEVYGIEKELIAGLSSQIVVEEAVVKMNINTATIEELGNHPYVTYSIAKAIVNYRNQHGPFHAVNELGKLYLLTEDWLNKMRPYLKV